MSLFDELISPASVSMMRRVLYSECARRQIKPDSIEGEELAHVVMNAFVRGMTEECELRCLVRNLVD